MERLGFIGGLSHAGRGDSLSNVGDSVCVCVSERACLHISQSGFQALSQASCQWRPRLQGHQKQNGGGWISGVPPHVSPCHHVECIESLCGRRNAVFPFSGELQAIAFLLAAFGKQHVSSVALIIIVRVVRSSCCAPR